ncbi:hypothetical protein FACS189418_1490 [Clostridia bacterium]|nr:hypothetical protein FACS189418_1490 [Clostridia bacterium]
MKKRTKKWLALTMTGTMLLTMFSGCSSSTQAGADTTGKNSITVEVFDRGTPGGSDPTNNFYTKWIQEKCLADIGLEVNFVSVPRTEEIPRLNNLMAAGKAPDIAFTYSIPTFFNFYKNGALADLTPYLENAPDLVDFLGKDVLDRGEVEGKQMAIPAKRVLKGKFSTYIRKDWLDALNLSLPTTTQEYYEALVAIKEQNPAGVSNVIPLTLTSDVAWRAGPLLQSFVKADITEEELYVNGVNESYMLMPGYKEGVRFLNKMYNEGLIDPEFSLYNDDNKSDDSVARGQTASLMHNWDWPYRSAPGIYNNLVQNVSEAELVPIDPFDDSNGTHRKSAYDPSGIRIIVPSTSKNPEGAVQYLNWLAKYENRYFLQTGVEGETFEMVDGLPVLKEGVTGDKAMNSLNNIDYVTILNGFDLGDEDKNIQYAVNAYPNASELAEEAYHISMNDAFYFPGINTPIESEAPVGSTLKEKEKALLANAIMAAVKDFDKVWDDGLQDWLNSGAEEARKERQQIWDSLNK